MITTVAEHKIDFDLLPEKANILDIGVRGWQFYDYMTSLGHIVCPVDIDDLKTNRSYYQCAISNYNGRAGIQYSNDPQATQIKDGNDVTCYTLESFIELVGIKFDMIKCDCEGSEREIIMSLDKAPAKILSIEWHLHTGIYDQNFMKLAETKLRMLGYQFLSHELTEEHGAGLNYWSSLFYNPKA